MEVDPLTLQTSDEKIFLAGDLVKGSSSVIEAMAGGKESAESAHRYLSDQPISYGRAYKGPVETDFEIELEPQETKVTRDESERGYKVRIEKQVVGRIHGGDTEFRLKTYNGDIVVRKAGG